MKDFATTISATFSVFFKICHQHSRPHKRLIPLKREKCALTYIDAMINHVLRKFSFVDGNCHFD